MPQKIISEFKIKIHLHFIIKTKSVTLMSYHLRVVTLVSTLFNILSNLFDYWIFTVYSIAIGLFDMNILCCFWLALLFVFIDVG